MLRSHFPLAIQNDYQELWTILDWTNPGAVGTKKQWDGFIARPLTRGQSKSASEDERVMAIVSQSLRGIITDVDSRPAERRQDLEGQTATEALLEKVRVRSFTPGEVGTDIRSGRRL